MLKAVTPKDEILREAVEIMKAILPEEDQEEIPVGFSIVGHVGKYSAIYICDIRVNAVQHT
jgi:hypothetical protein